MIGWKLDITFHGVDGQHFLHMLYPLHHSDKPQMYVEINANTKHSLGNVVAHHLKSHW